MTPPSNRGSAVGEGFSPSHGRASAFAERYVGTSPASPTAAAKAMAVKRLRRDK